jgi:hypothetical protein
MSFGAYWLLYRPKKVALRKPRLMAVQEIQGRKHRPWTIGRDAGLTKQQMAEARAVRDAALLNDAIQRVLAKSLAQADIKAVFKIFQGVGAQHRGVRECLAEPVGAPVCQRQEHYAGPCIDPRVFDASDWLW